MASSTFGALSDFLPDDPENARDIELMRLIATGDETAMRDLVERHQARVIGTVTRMLGSDREAEDVAQQVFVRIWRSAGRYQPNAKFTTWMFTIVRNLVFNHTRRYRGQIQTELDEEMGDEHQKTPDEDVLEAEKQRAIQQAIDALPEAQRLAVVLRRYDNVPYGEIARIMGQTVPGVKSLLFRARTSLRESLRKYLE
ncbi:MAG TPA: sigma-70 family RNA polymerase sigma factor [Chthoniobacterales bacterium]